jgi:hypothetical protein
MEKWVTALGWCGKEKRDEKRYTSCREFRPKELRECRKGFLIFRI